MSKTFNNVLFATFGVLFAQVLGSLRSFVLAGLISPYDYGIWTGVQMIVTLSPIVCLGTVEALLKQVPFYRGNHDVAGLKRVEAGVFATMAISAVIVAGLFLVCHQLLPFKFVQEHLLLAQLTAASAATGFFRAFYYHRCAAYEDFKSVGKIDALQSMAGFTFVLLFAWKWGLTGGVAGFFLGELLTWISAGHICGQAHGNVRPCFQPAPMLSAVRVGFPITIIWWVFALQATVGRMISISYLGNTQTGYFGAGSSMAMIFALVPNTIGRVFYPRINAQIGENADLQDIRQSVVMPTSAIALLLPIAQVVIFYLLPVIYNDFLPKYRDGLTCAQILILGAFFVGLIRNGANYLIAKDMQMHLMKYVLISLVANTAGCGVLVWLGFGINGLSVSASLASALLAALIWNRVLAELEYDRKSQLFIFANFYLSFLGILAAIAIVGFGFSGSAVYSRGQLILKMFLALSISTVVILSFASTRGQLRDLYRRSLSHFLYRFRKPSVK